MAKRLWSTLAPSTKARYARYGVSPQQYNAGKISTGFRQTIMGKGGDSFAVQRARQAGLDKILHEFDALPKKQRENMADLWLKGRTQRNKPVTLPGVELPPDADYLTRKERAYIHSDGGAFNLEPVDLEPGDHYGKPLLNTDIMNAQMTLDDWWQRIGADEMTAEDWVAFKLAYTTSFTKQ